MFFELGLIIVILNVISFVKFMYRNYFRIPHNLSDRYGKDSWAIVTGSTSGIGLEMCRHLASRGINIVLVGRDKQRLNNAVLEVRSMNTQIQTKTILFDLSWQQTAEDYEKIFDSIKDLDVSILINNAATWVTSTFLDSKVEDGRDTVTANLIAPTMFIRLFLNRLNSRKNRSAIINVASILGVAPAPNSTIYSSTKASVRYLTLALANEGYQNIDFMCLSPGFVTTKMVWYKKGLDTWYPDTTAHNTFRDLGFEQETNAYSVHEMMHYISQTAYKLVPSLYLQIFGNMSSNELQDRLEKEANMK